MIKPRSGIKRGGMANVFPPMAPPWAGPRIKPPKDDPNDWKPLSPPPLISELLPDWEKYAGKGTYSMVRRAEEVIKNFSIENALIFDNKGNLIERIGGKRGSITPSKSDEERLLRLKDVIVTHNHPTSNIARFAGTLSFTDVKSMVRSDWREIRAVSRGQGEGLYILRRRADARPEAFLKHLKHAERKMNRKIAKLYAKTYDEVKAKTGDIFIAERVAMQKSIGIVHRHYKKVASQYGYDYVARKKPIPFD